MISFLFLIILCLIFSGIFFVRWLCRYSRQIFTNGRHDLFHNHKKVKKLHTIKKLCKQPQNSIIFEFQIASFVNLLVDCCSSCWRHIRFPKPQLQESLIFANPGRIFPGKLWNGHGKRRKCRNWCCSRTTTSFKAGLDDTGEQIHKVLR